jgi:hypothetical protein
MVAPGLYEGFVDTTFALYPADWQQVLHNDRMTNVGHRPADSLRAAPPYAFRHPDWEYQDGQAVSEEDEFYLRRAQRDIATTLRWAVEEEGRLVVRVPRLRTLPHRG